MFSPPCICNIRMLRGGCGAFSAQPGPVCALCPACAPNSARRVAGALPCAKGGCGFAHGVRRFSARPILHFGHFQRNAYAPNGNDITLFGICHPKKRLALFLFFRHSGQGRPKIYAAPYSKPHPGRQKGAQPKPGPGSNDPGPGTVSDDACSDWISP